KSTETQIGGGGDASGRSSWWQWPRTARFLWEMAHEKPIRFTPRQLAGFTRGYSARLGAGGFGTVYGGALPNGLGVAVKVLRSGMGRRSEEQFMAEVGTIGRTHHINLVRLFGFCFDAAVRTLVYEFMGDGALDAYLFDRTRAVGDSDGLRSPPSSSLWAEAAVSQNRRKPKSAAAATRRGGARGGSGRGRRGWR
ncbi:Os11g0294800, partial [Oryza sativa Japonica Group]